MLKQFLFQHYNNRKNLLLPSAVFRISFCRLLKFDFFTLLCQFVPILIWSCSTDATAVYFSVIFFPLFCCFVLVWFPWKLLSIYIIFIWHHLYSVHLCRGYHIITITNNYTTTHNRHWWVGGRGKRPCIHKLKNNHWKITRWWYLIVYPYCVCFFIFRPFLSLHYSFGQKVLN